MGWSIKRNHKLGSQENSQTGATAEKYEKKARKSDKQLMSSGLLLDNDKDSSGKHIRQASSSHNQICFWVLYLIVKSGGK